MKKSKIYPGIETSSDDLLVDSVLKRVDQSIDNITRETEELIKRFNLNDPNEAISKNSFPWVSLNIKNLNKDMNQKNYLENSESKELNDRMNQGNNDEVEEFSPYEDTVEEIKLSHQVAKEENDLALASDLQDKFSILMNQINQYKELYRQINEKLRESESRLYDTENKLEDVEDQKSYLEQQLLGIQSKNPLSGLNLAFKPNYKNLNNKTKEEMDILQKRSEDLRKMLLFEQDETIEHDALPVNNLDKFWGAKKGFIMLQEWFNSHFTPFRGDIRTIQARFGSSVSSYFIFYRFLFVQAAIISGLISGFFILHMINLSAKLTFSNYFDFTGYLPYVITPASFSQSEGLLHNLSLLTVISALLISICYKYILEDKLAKDMDALDAENNTAYSKEVLCGWDNSIISKAQIDDFAGNLANNLQLKLDESYTKGKTNSRSQYDTFRIYCRRILGIALYLTIVFLSFVAIIVVTIRSSLINKSVSHIPVVKSLSSIFVSLILSIINNTSPLLFEYIALFEDWDSAQVIANVKIFRSYLSSILNAMILALSYLILADPVLLANNPWFRKGLGVKVSIDYSCRLDQASSGLFTLVLSTWILNLIVMVFIPYWYMLLAYLFNYTYKKPEFSVTDNIVNRTTLSALTMMALPFCPFIYILVPFLLFIGFKTEKLILKRYYSKPLRPWKGQKAGFIYVRFYFLTYILIGLSITSYFLTSKTFSKSCDIQDEGVGLCEANSYDDTTKTCVLKVASSYYSYFQKTSYPKDICSNSCGPFVHRRTNFSPFLSTLKDHSIASVIWSLCFEYPYIPWISTIILALAIASMYNSLEISRIISFSKEKSLEAQIVAIENERKKQDRVIKRLKLIEEPTNIE